MRADRDGHGQRRIGHDLSLSAISDGAIAVADSCSYTDSSRSCIESTPDLVVRTATHSKMGCGVGVRS